MRVLMLGWEFPPFISGGLGTACYGLTKAMSQLGVDVVFVLPKPVRTQLSTHVKLLAPAVSGIQGPGAAEPAEAGGWSVESLEHVTFKTVPVHAFSVYARPKLRLKQEPHGRGWMQVAPGRVETRSQAERRRIRAARALRPDGATNGSPELYTGDMFTEVERYARMVGEIAAEEAFDVIHAHDWMTYPAGIAAAAISGKPLVVHVHSTEFDRSGEHVNQRIYDIERAGMHAADKVAAVSFLTKGIIVSRYGVPGEKVEVVYNAVEANGQQKVDGRLPAAIGRDEKIVLFLGRITMQKGPDYFLAAAKKVLEVMPDVRFIMAGSGDMVRRTVEMAVHMGIGHKVLFTGFLRGDDVAKVFKMADVYVMPSVSEPFGIAPLEALSHDVPAIISKQSGVSEVLTHVLKVDFWDINEIANKIIAVLRHPPLRETLKRHASLEVRKFSWQDAARQCVQMYQQAASPTGRVG